jgi:hypothetical protein
MSISVATLAWTLPFGARLTTAGRFARANGLGSAGQLLGGGVEAEHGIPWDSAGLYLTWDSSAADATTDMKIHIDGVAGAIINCTGVQGSVSIADLYTFAKGERIMLEFDGGQIPDWSVWTITGVGGG